MQTVTFVSERPSAAESSPLCLEMFVLFLAARAIGSEDVRLIYEPVNLSSVTLLEFDDVSSY